MTSFFGYDYAQELAVSSETSASHAPREDARRSASSACAPLAARGPAPMAPKKNKSKGGGGDSAAPSPASTPRKPEEDPPAADGDDEEVEDAETAGNKRDGADVSKVTDFVEQKELDSARAKQAMASIMQAQKVATEAELAHERELAAVTISQPDVDLIAQEMELEKAVAERALREAKGDVTTALNNLVAAS